MIIQSKRNIVAASAVSSQSLAAAAYRAAGAAFNTDYPTTILATSGLVAYWKLNEASGPTVADATGGGKTGTASGSPTFNQTGASIPGGSSIRFVRASSQYIQFANIAMTKPFAIELWVNPQSTTTDQWYFTKLGANAKVGLVGSNNGLCTVFRAFNYGYVNIGYIPPTGTWYHVVVMQDSAGIGWLYLNGFLMDYGNISDVATDSQFVQIGGETSAYCDAYISHVALYNRMLTEAEIRQHCQRPAQNIISSQDAGYYLDKSGVLAIGGSFNYAY